MRCPICGEEETHKDRLYSLPHILEELGYGPPGRAHVRCAIEGKERLIKEAAKRGLSVKDLVDSGQL